MIKKQHKILFGRELELNVMDVMNAVKRAAIGWRMTNTISSGRIVSSFEELLCSLKKDVVSSTFIDMLREVIVSVDKKTGADQVTVALLTCDIVIYAMQQFAAGTKIRDVISAIDSLETLYYEVQNLTKKPSKDDLRTIISNNISDENLVEMVCDAYEISGLDGHIFFEVNQHILEPQVELNVGYYFDSVFPITSTLDVSKLQYDDVRIACIDGICESAAELDSLFSGACEAKEPLAIFARKFSDDVLHTISVNNRRKTLNVVPIVVPFDLDSANVLKDIAVVSGGTVTSALEGKLISSIIFQDLPIVQSIEIKSNVVIIENKCTKSAVEFHISQLKKNSTNELTTPIIYKRIRALSSRTVNVKMPKHDEHLATSVDKTLRYVKSAITKGIVRTEKLKNVVLKSQLDKRLQELMLNWVSSFNSVEAIEAILTMILIAKANAKLITTTAAFVAS